MRVLTNALAILVLSSGLFAAATTAANARMLAPKVKAGQGCPSLAPVEQWGRRTVKGEILAFRVFCGDFNTDGHADAIAFVYYNPEGELGIFDKIALFRNLNGQLRYLRSVKNLYGQPEHASFASGRIILDMLTLKDTDPECCPTGRSRVVVDVATGTSKSLP